MAKLSFLGQMDDGAEYATDGDNVYQLVPGKEGEHAVPVEPDRAQRVVKLAAEKGTPKDQPGALSDFGREVMTGFAAIPAAAGRVMEAAGFDRSGKAVREASDNAVESWQGGLSFDQQQADKQPLLEGGWHNPSKIAGMVGQTLGPSMLGIGGGGVLTKLLRLARISPGTAGMVGNSLSEGSIQGVMDAGQVGQIIDQIPEEKLIHAKPYQAAYWDLPDTMDDAERRRQARESVKKAAMLEAGIASGVTGAMLSTPAGYTLGTAIGGETGKTLGGTIRRQIGLEAFQEGTQGPVGQLSQNRAVKQYADPSQPLTEGMLEQAISGKIVGGLLGGVAGAGAHKPTIADATAKANAVIAALKALPAPVVIVDPKGNAATEAQRANAAATAEQRARAAESAGDAETALQIRRNALAPELAPQPASPPSDPGMDVEFIQPTEIDAAPALPQSDLEAAVTELSDAARRKAETPVSNVDVQELPQTDIEAAPPPALQAEEPFPPAAPKGGIKVEHIPVTDIQYPLPEQAAVQQPEQAIKDLTAKSVPIEKPLYERNISELETLAAQQKNDFRALTDEVFGKDAANYRRWINSDTNYSKAEELLKNLPPEQRAKIEAADSVGFNDDEIKSYISAYRDVNSAETPEELASVLRKTVTEIGDAVDPAKATASERLALTKLRYAGEYAAQQGWDLKAISDQALQQASSQFKDLTDAEFMLRRFLQPGESLPDASANPQLPRASDNAAAPIKVAGSQAGAETITNPVTADKKNPDVGITHELTIKDVPPIVARRVKVSVNQLVEGKGVESVETTAADALKDLGREIAAFNKLLKCIRR